MCPVNSQNEENLAGQGEARLRPLCLPEAWWLAGCRGFVTADVLEKGLNREAIATG